MKFNAYTRMIDGWILLHLFYDEVRWQYDIKVLSVIDLYPINGNIKNTMYKTRKIYLNGEVREYIVNRLFFKPIIFLDILFRLCVGIVFVGFNLAWVTWSVLCKKR